MTKETSYTIFQNVIAELIKVDIKFFAQSLHSNCSIDVYSTDVEKVLSLDLGFVEKTNHKLTGETFQSAHLVLPVTESAVKAARQQNLSGKPLFID